MGNTSCGTAFLLGQGGKGYPQALSGTERISISEIYVLKVSAYGAVFGSMELPRLVGLPGLGHGEVTSSLASFEFCLQTSTKDRFLLLNGTMFCLFIASTKMPSNHSSSLCTRTEESIT